MTYENLLSSEIKRRKLSEKRFFGFILTCIGIIEVSPMIFLKFFMCLYIVVNNQLFSNKGLMDEIVLCYLAFGFLYFWFGILIFKNIRHININLSFIKFFCSIGEVSSLLFGLYLLITSHYTLTFIYGTTIILDHRKKQKWLIDD